MFQHLHCPPRWAESCAAVANQLESFRVEELDSESKEFKVIASLVPHCMTVDSVNRIVNPTLWRRLKMSRIEMLLQKSSDVSILETLPVDAMELEAAKVMARNFQRHNSLNEMHYSDNMTLLFHGSYSENLDPIFAQGLDERLAHKGLLGKCIYLGQNPAYAAIYDKNNVIIVFAVLLGDCLKLQTTVGKSALVREIPKAAIQKRTPNDQSFDSILARPDKSKSIEYGIFNRYQCCPLYSIYYKRTSSVLPLEEMFPEPPFAWHSTDDGCLPQRVPESTPPWPLLARSIFEKMNETELPTRPSSSEVAEIQEDCQLCETTFEMRNSALKCSHKLCEQCLELQKKEGKSMSGISYAYYKCQLCSVVTGTEIGSCPDGTLTITKKEESLKGYELYGCLQLDFLFQGFPGISTTTFLPDSTEGLELARMIEIAFDRRLVFKLEGTEYKWNIEPRLRLQEDVEQDLPYLHRLKHQLQKYEIN